MTIDVFAANEQQSHAVDLDRWVKLTREVLVAEGINDDAEVSLLFVDETTIAGLNEEFLGKTGPTDVLSFPIEDDLVTTGRTPDEGGSGPGSLALPEPTLLLGDVVICPAVAAKNAVDHEVTVDDETALLVVHGLLHLLGMDHVVDAEAEVMEAKERMLLRRFYGSSWGTSSETTP